MSAQIAQRFATIDRRSNGSHHVSLVYNAASNPNPNPIPLLLPQSLLSSPASPIPLPRFASSEGIGTTRPVGSTSPQSPSHTPPSLARILPFPAHSFRLPPLVAARRSPRLRPRRAPAGECSGPFPLLIPLVSSRSGHVGIFDLVGDLLWSLPPSSTQRIQTPSSGAKKVGGTAPPATTTQQGGSQAFRFGTLLPAPRWSGAALSRSSGGCSSRGWLSAPAATTSIPDPMVAT
jgi:hypothetical protein